MAGKNTFSAKAKTPLFKGAFVRVFEDTAEIDKKTGKKSWGLVAILPKGSDISGVNAAIKDAAEKNWGPKTGLTMKHKNFKHPIKTGDEFRRREDGELYTGFAEDDICFKIGSKSKAPGIVDRLARIIASEDGATLVDKKNDVYDIVETNKVYSGCYFFATFTAMAWEHEDGANGVSLLLENLQLVKQGESLGGGGSGSGARDASSDFGIVEGADADDLSNLLGV
jgi:hypothetical protein